MAVDMFLKLDGIKGESTDERHRDEIEIESFSWGLSNLGTASATGGAGAGKVSFQDIHFVKKADKASPQLMLHCASGEHIKDATLTVRKAGGDSKVDLEFMTVKLTDILVSSFSSKAEPGSEGQTDPEEALSLNFAKIEFSLMSETTGWDLKTNKSIIGVLRTDQP